MNNIKIDVNQLVLRIQQTGDRVVRGVTKVLKEEADNVALAAIGNAPVDDMNLEAAIRVERRGGGRGPDGKFVRIFFEVFVDETKGAGNGKTVGDYWLIMHEQLAPYGSGGFKLGEDSRKKAAQGYDVGGKFMERAAVDNKRRVFKRALEAAKRELRRKL